MAVDQEAFRWRNDDGGEISATWKAAQNVDVTSPLGANIRLRVLLQSTGDPLPVTYVLRYKEDSEGSYVAVPVGASQAQVAPNVEATAETVVGTAGTSHAITLPAGIVSTDEVIILMNIGSTSASLNALTGWTELLDEAVASGLKILRYTGAGVPSNPTFVSSASTRSVSIAYRISGADKTVTPQIGTTATGTSATPDPPSVTPSAGSKPYLFIAFFGQGGEELDDDTWVNTPPTNYLPSPPLQAAGGTAGSNLGALIGAAHRQLTTGASENPGTFGVDVSAAWRAQTIIVHPAAGAANRLYISPSSNITAGGEATTSQLTPLSGSGGVSVSDDFNRADGSGLGANWTQIANDSIDISGNRARSDSGFPTAVVHVTETGTTKCFAQASFDQDESSGKVGGEPIIIICSDASFSYPNIGGYVARVDAVGNLYVLRNGTQMGASVSTGFSNGTHVWRIQHDGAGEVTVWCDGVLQATRTDGTPLTTKKHGFGWSSVAFGGEYAYVDNYSAGDMVFTPGRIWDDENGSDSIDIGAGLYTELEWSLQAQSPAANGDIYQFRVYADSSPLDTYTQTPDWTIGVDLNGGSVTGAVGWVGTVTGARNSQGSLTGAVGWAGTVTGVKAPQGSVTGAVGWAGSVTGDAPTILPNEGEVDGSVGWAGTVTGSRESRAAVFGATDWVGTVTGARQPVGSVSGTIEWVGVVVGANLGVVLGAIGWVGSVSGSRPSLGSVTGAVDWDGDVTGEAPVVGSNEGSVDGSISWIGTVTGVMLPAGSVAGAIEWAGSVDGEAPSVGTAEGSVSGVVSWTGQVTGVKAPNGAVSGGITWVGVVTGSTLLGGIVGYITGEIDGPGVTTLVIDGPGIARVIGGPNSFRVMTGPDISLEEVEGPGNTELELVGPNISRTIDGPKTSRTVTGPES